MLVIVYSADLFLYTLSTTVYYQVNHRFGQIICFWILRIYFVQEIVTNQLVIPFVMMETIMWLVNLMVETVITNKEQEEFLGTIGVRLVIYSILHWLVLIDSICENCCLEFGAYNFWISSHFLIFNLIYKKFKISYYVFMLNLWDIQILPKLSCWEDLNFGLQL